jgi:hypothetical protein
LRSPLVGVALISSRRALPGLAVLFPGLSGCFLVFLATGDVVGDDLVVGDDGGLADVVDVGEALVATVPDGD